MALSLDSNVLIDLGNGDDPTVRERFVAARQRGESLHCSPQVLHEVVYGTLISGRPLHHSEVLERTLTGVFLEAYTVEDARASAQVRAARLRLGKPMGALDAMIAGQALARGWTVVTADADDFERIPGLTVVNWRAAAESWDK